MSFWVIVIGGGGIVAYLWFSDRIKKPEEKKTEMEEYQTNLINTEGPDRARIAYIQKQMMQIVRDETQRNFLDEKNYKNERDFARELERMASIMKIDHRNETLVTVSAIPPEAILKRKITETIKHTLPLVRINPVIQGKYIKPV